MRFSKVWPVLICCIIALGFCLDRADAGVSGGPYDLPDPFAVIVADTVPDRDTLVDRQGNFIDDPVDNPFDLRDPNAIEQTVEYDPILDRYIITERIGNEFYRAPTYMTFDEYMDWKAEQDQDSYFQYLNGVASGDRNAGGNVDPITAVDIQNDIINRLFGGTEIDIRPQGNIDITLGADYQKQENPILPIRQQRRGGFDFDMDVQVSVDGKIGEKLDVGFNYNTRSTFDFENQLKLDYNSQEFGEDDILQKIEAGNVSLPLRGTLIQGTQNLFGLKTELQFGHLRLTAIASQQRSEKNDIVIEGGSVVQQFEVPIDEYVQNRNFLLSHFNWDQFEGTLRNLPQINSLFRITRLEVWITNVKNQTTDVRDIVAISDLGESRRMTPGNEVWVDPMDTMDLKDLCGDYVLPANQANGMLEFLQSDPENRYVDNAIRVLREDMNLQASRDFEKIRARRLSPSEFNYHPELGYISLNVNVQPDQVVGVAYEYTYNGEQFRVGELSDVIPVDPENQSVLYVKMLKSTIARVDLPIWDLMMKNFYRVGGGDLTPGDFELDVFYENPGAGFNRFLPDETGLDNVPLLTAFNLDNLNAQGDPQPDGRFDFVEGLTIYPRVGYMMFPRLEPFGSSLERFIDQNGGMNAEDVIYQELYDSTLFRAQEFPEKNRFTIKGESKSSTSSDISLGTFNIPPGSVQVYAGGQRLVENQDYVIDYNIGRLKILNESYIQPGTPIRVSFEDNALFSFQKKTMLGLRADYEVSDKLFVGATLMKLFERPYTQKVNIGDDPINNNIYGLDMSYSDKAPWLTRLVDKIPGISTKEESNINFQAEFAALQPGHSRAINANDDNSGTVYLDDFEGTTSNFDLRTPENRWQLSSVPRNVRIEGQDFFPESELVNDLDAGTNRALLNWYRIDRSVRTSVDNQNEYTRRIDQQEIFRGRTPRFGANDFRTLDLNYYPDRRGPYNFDVPGGTPYSEGLNDECRLEAPQTRWGGIQRALQNTDFEQANFEFVEFWMLDPYIYDTLGNTEFQEGYLVINLGNVSEDVLPDGRLFYEHGLPQESEETDTDTTNWGRIPKIQPVVNAFSIDIDARIQQDIGYDGWSDSTERVFYSDYVNTINNSNLPLDCKAEILQDPANDNFLFFNDPMFSDNARIFERYRKFNNPEGNSPPNPQQNNTVSANTNRPNNEDLNGDLSLQEGEQYYQYVIKMVRGADGKPRFESLGKEIAGVQYDWQQDTISADARTWYRFRIPIDQGKPVGGIQGYRSIRFMRMYMTGFDQQTVLRFATLDLVRSQWRRYTRSQCFGDDNLSFEMDAVNIEENSAKVPFNYVVPEGIQRERIVGSTFQDVFQNEQSLSMVFCGLQDNCDVRIFKPLDLDLRLYERLQMFNHLESSRDPSQPPIENNQARLFIRLGSDFENNYYEYELPLTPSTDTMLRADPEEVWKPDSNDVDLAFEELTNLKITRNNLAFPFDQEYSEEVEGSGKRYRLSIKGNPTLGYVKNVMIGVRNPEGGQANLCGEVWVNELRVSGLSEDGGIAGLARLDMDLADFGNIGLATRFSTIGYGAIDQQLQERAREQTFQFDASLGLQLGKFFGKEAGVSIPFYTQYSTTIETPQFDPIDLDLELKDKLERAPDRETRDSVRDQARRFNSLYVLNFTNVRKQKTKQGASMPWDISNFGVSYSYTKSKTSDEVIENDEITQHRAQLDYSYAFPQVDFQPFKGLSKSNWLKWLTEFNISPLPNSFSFNTVMERRFGERSYRFSDPIFKTWFDKRFSWDRTYNLTWDITKSISFDFNAFNGAVIDEPDEYTDRFAEDRITKKERRDSIWTNIAKFGRTKQYDHNFRLSYRLPTQLFPFLDWTRADATYNANYSWSAAALNTDSLGNVIQNGQSIQLTADLDFTRLYNKSKFLAKINGQGGAGRSRDPRSRARRGGDPRANQQQQQKPQDKEKAKDGEPSTVAKIFLRPLMMIRKFRLTYNIERSTVLPGYNQTSGLLGMNKFTSPGWDFIAGIQPEIGRFESSSGDWLDEIGFGGNEWVVDNVFQAQPLSQSESRNLDGRLSLEPFADFKIDLDFKRQLTTNFSMFYKNVDKTDVTFERLSPREVGSFTLSYFSMQTLFKGSVDEINDLFNTFEAYRSNVSQERGDPNTTHPFDGEAYTFGFGEKQRDVLVPAFIAAYTNKDPDNFQLTDMFNWLPRPNWTLNYTGLNKVGNLKEVFSSVRISHGYKSTLTINSFETDLNYKPPQINDENINEATQNYFSQYVVPTLGLVEEFSPLIGIDIRTRNDINLRFNFNKRRGLQMGFVSYELAETRSTGIEAGFNWILRDVRLGFLPGFKDKDAQAQQVGPSSGRGRAQAQSNDLEFIFDFSFSDNITVNHYLDQESLPQPTRGSRDVSISPAIRYNLNKFINLRLFVDYRRTVPYTTTGYPITSIEGGLTIQVVLQ